MGSLALVVFASGRVGQAFAPIGLGRFVFPTRRGLAFFHPAGVVKIFGNGVKIT